jgi:peptidoglycan hydrolase-like protein with peptidoglycan-binding domain
VTASEVAPEPCDDDDPSLATGSIRPGQQGTRVAALQVALVNVGYVIPVDGRYGPLTEAAVVDFQLLNGIDPIGIAGPRTRAALGI